MCYIVSCVFCIYCLHFFIDRKLNWFLVAGTIFNFLSLIFILVFPGNAARKIAETKTWFPEFNDLSIFRKLEMGFSGTLFEYIIKPNFLFFIFAVFLFACVCLVHDETLFRIMPLFRLQLTLSLIAIDVDIPTTHQSCTVSVLQ